MNQLTTITIGSTTVNQDLHGRYCLNDLHHATGGENRHRPSLWMANQQTQELIQALNSEAGIPASVTLKGGSSTGTYVVRELVYAYAMWVSAAFHLAVIRAFDVMMTGGASQQRSEPQVPLTTYVAALERVVDLQQQLLQARPVFVPGVQPHHSAGPRRYNTDRSGHPWMEPLRRWLEAHLEVREVTSTQLLVQALGIEQRLVTMVQQGTVGRLMSTLGWSRGRRRNPLRNVYVRPGATARSPAPGARLPPADCVASDAP